MEWNRLFFKYGAYYPVVIASGAWTYPPLQQLRSSQYWSAGELEGLQLARLNRLLGHANEHVPYYRQWPRRLETLAELGSLPTVDKSDIRANFQAFLSKLQPLRRTNKTSGGSTGAAVTVRKSNVSMAHELAGLWRGYEWAGIDIGHRQARFWGVAGQGADRLRGRIIDLIANRRRLSAFAFSEADLERYVSELERFEPHYFYGYVSMLRAFAEFVAARGYHGRLRPRAIVTTSEVLTPADRQLLAETFHCRVFNEYGCGEVGGIAHECEHGSMHVTAENMVLEILDSTGRAVPAGEPGEIVITELTNLCMPLIRYRMKDFGSISDRPCACGRSLPVLQGLYGREYDMLVNSRGERFHGELFLYMIEDLKRAGVPVSGVQFEQTSPSVLVVRLVIAEPDLTQASQALTRTLHERFDANIQVTFERVAAIQREASGKLRVVKRSFH
jgi:phenylacetate-CoA ligase